MPHVAVLPTALSIDRVYHTLRSDDVGAVVLMVGCVRNHTAKEGRSVVVEALHYEAYEAMAVRVMTDLAANIESRIPGVRICVEHRVGDLVIGDIAVVVGAAAAHRGDAFTAARAMIDELKQHAPIWKRETDADGVQWVGLGP
jgi:molybdopterin synthase catalytic subunit